jgi:hypothetical protein
MKNSIYLQRGPQKYLKIVDEPGRNNEGMICKTHGHVWLKKDGTSERCLIREIKEAGGDFLAEQGYVELGEGQRPCVSGSGYKGGISFGSVESAENYLKQYFRLKHHE